MRDDTDVRAVVRDWTEPLPEHPEAVFEAVWPVLGAVVVDSPNAMIVATIAEGRYMRWEVRGRLPGTIDDLVRCMVEYSKAEAVVVVHPVPVPSGVEADEALSFTCESPTGRIPYVVSVRHVDDGVSWQLGRLADPDVQPRWVGVPPGGDVVLWEMGPDSMLGPTAEA